MPSHGIELVAVVLAVLKIGATYVPLDARHPRARLAHIVRDSGARLVVHSREHAQVAADLGLPRVCLDELRLGHEAGLLRPDRSRRPRSEDLAYILYTSGSTGAPKGVGISHSNLLNYVAWARDRYFASPTDRIALYTTLAFDFTVTCIFPPLVAGASIGIYDGLSDPMAIREIVDDDAITVVKITPSFLHVLSQLLCGQRSLRRVIVGGEDLKVPLAAKVHAQLGGAAEIINEYGPTEATVGCFSHVFDPVRDRDGSVPIGSPIPGVQAYVVNERGGLVDGDGEGELCVAGRSVAAGYLNAEARTQASFVVNPFTPGTRTYRTGDLVRRKPSGALLFAGRRDDQVKIRGNRVELSEVTDAILRLPGVEAAYVTAVRDLGSAALAAVVTGRDGLEAQSVATKLAAILPSYMVPTILRVVPALPMTANHKIDRAAVLAVFGREGA